VRKKSVVAPLAVAAPVTSEASLVVRARNVPFDAVLHVRSPAGLVVRAGAPGEVFVAAQNVAVERRLNVHPAFALTVNVGPVVALKPASKSVGVGAVRAVDPAPICSRTTRPAVIDTLPSWVQLAPSPVAEHCASAVAGNADQPITMAKPATPSPGNFLISSPVPL
jgi:hypothetical protein